MKRYYKWIVGISAAMLAAVTWLSVCADAQNPKYFQGDYDDSLYRNGGYDASYDPNYDCNENDTQETKFFLKDNFTYTTHPDDEYCKEAKGIPSGWDARLIGGTIKGPYYHGNYQLIDTSEFYPVELTRKFEKAKHGVMTIEMQVKFGEGLNGAALELCSDNIAAVSFVSDGSKLYMMNAAGEGTYLFDYTVGEFFGLKAVLDIDNNIVKTVYKSGQIVAENIPFTNDIEYINGFLANTGDKATGTLAFNAVYIYRGYSVQEQFLSAMNGVPSDLKTGGSVSMVNWESSSKPDVYSMKLDGAEGQNAYAEKKFDAISGKITAGMFIYSDTSNDGIKMSLLNNGGSVLDIKVVNGKLRYVLPNGEEKEIYYFTEKLWNKLSVNIDTDSHTVDIYVNYKLAAESVSFAADRIDGIRADSAKNTLVIDDIIVYNRVEPENYVPVPQKVESEGYLLSMQFCPMWTEGTHMGWDHENSYKEKIPYIGLYDGDSPEAMDWTIKQLAEHGFDYMSVVWCGEPTSTAPPKSAFIGGSFMDAYFNSKYKELMPFAILWENVAMNGEASRLTDNLAPYWIEYYFKNPNYFKIDGRPVVGIYNANTFISKTEAVGGTKRDCVEAIKKFRQMCIDAGVGNPIMIASAGSAELLEELGFDAYRPYWYGGENDFDQYAYQLGERFSNKNVKAVPTVGNGAAYWGKFQVLNPVDFENQLRNIRDNYFTKYSTGLFNMINIETYDEYSEGHWIAPSSLYGFGYLDAVRDVFVNEESHEHTDSVPTMQQKDRFNNLYPYGRKTKEFNLAVKGNGSKENLVVKKGWYFDTDGNTEGWGGANISDVTVKNGMLCAKAVNEDPQIIISGIGLDLSDVTYIRVKYHHSNNAEIQMFFKTDTSGGFSETNSITYSNVGKEDGAAWAFVGGLLNFNGTLDSLRLDTGRIAGAAVEIDSIEILSDPTISSEIYEVPGGFNVNINSVLKRCDNESINIYNTMYFPLRDIAELMNAVVDYDSKNNVVNVLHNETRFKIDLKTNDVLLNDKPINAKSPMYLADGKTYVTARVLAMLFNVDVEWSEEEQTLNILSDEGKELMLQVEQNKKPREQFVSYEFEEEGNKQGWTHDGNNVSGMSVSDGTLKGTVSKAVIIFTPNNLDIPAKDVKVISFSLKNPTNSSEAMLFYITDTDGTWNESKKLTVKIDKHSEQLQTYYVDASALNSRTDNIKQIRLSLNSVVSGDKFELGSFAVLGDFIQSSDSSMLAWNTEGEHITFTNTRIAWEFYTNGSKNGWLLSRSFANINIKNGALCADIIGQTPVLQTSGLALDASRVKSIKIRYKNNTPSTKAKLYFLKNDSQQWLEDECFVIDTYAYDEVGNIYEIIPSENENWSGSIGAFRFEPAYDIGSIGIDYIRIELN